MSNSNWFHGYVDKTGNVLLNKMPVGENGFYECPSCQIPVIGELAGYEICELCGWEDDGQTSKDVDEVWGGPNGCLSPMESRIKYRETAPKQEVALVDAYLNEADKEKRLEILFRIFNKLSISSKLSEGEAKEFEVYRKKSRIYKLIAEIYEQSKYDLKLMKSIDKAVYANSLGGVTNSIYGRWDIYPNDHIIFIPCVTSVSQGEDRVKVSYKHLLEAEDKALVKNKMMSYRDKNVFKEKNFLPLLKEFIELCPEESVGLLEDYLSVFE